MNQFQPGDTHTDRRLLLAMLLATVVLLLTPYIIQWFYPTLEQPPEDRAALQEPSQETPPSPAESRLPVEEPPLEEEATAGEEDPTDTHGKPEVFTIQNQDVAYQVNTVGGVLESVQLLAYRRADGAPLELVPQEFPADFPLPLAVRSGRSELDAVLSRAVYEVTGVPPQGEPLRSPAEIRLSYRSRGLEVERVMRIPVSGYEFGLSSRLVNRGNVLEQRLVLGPGIGPKPEPPVSFFSVSGVSDFAAPQIAFFDPAAQEVVRHAVGSVEAAQELGTAARWLAYDSQYFTYLFLDGAAGINGVRLEPGEWEIPGPEGGEPAKNQLLIGEARLPGQFDLRVFFGPKDPEILSDTDPTLKELIDYGWFGLLVKPLLFLLKLIYGFIANYGWAIIILTFAINLVLMPLRYKQTVSMKKMTLVQPKMKAIQEKYKKLARDDPKRQEMNKEMMELYQKHGVNPLGGCLPLLIQMPFLFAFYRMLAYSIELRGAPFMLWIQDLSRPDPYYVTPIAMGATMILQQHFTPSGGDPTTRRMMMIMPVMFTFIFLSVSSGLALYFLFSNIFGMGFLWIMQKMAEEEEEKPSSKPKRNSKKKVRAR